MDVIEYYNQYASKIFEDTVELDMEEARQKFLSRLEEGDTILDLGCGSGRDSLAFYELGYDVTPLDASEEMCKLAEIHTGLEVLQMTYEEMEFDDVFDGIWGCQALIHTPEDELSDLLDRIADALHTKGILYLSFQEGEFEGSRGNRYICEYTEERLTRILKENGRFQVLELWKTKTVHGSKERSWLNLLAKKIS